MTPSHTWVQVTDHNDGSLIINQNVTENSYSFPVSPERHGHRLGYQVFRLYCEHHLPPESSGFSIEPPNPVIEYPAGQGGFKLPANAREQKLLP